MRHFAASAAPRKWLRRPPSSPDHGAPLVTSCLCPREQLNGTTKPRVLQLYHWLLLLTHSCCNILSKCSSLTQPPFSPSSLSSSRPCLSFFPLPFWDNPPTRATHSLVPQLPPSNSPARGSFCTELKAPPTRQIKSSRLPSSSFLSPNNSFHLLSNITSIEPQLSRLFLSRYPPPQQTCPTFPMSPSSSKRTKV